MRLVLLALGTLLLTGCSATVSLEPAAEANDPNCAEVMVRLPQELGEHFERLTNAQATAAWGDPTAVILRCGLEPVVVSDLPCVTAGEVDWLVDDSLAPNYRFTSFARFPAVEVIVDSERASGVTSLELLSRAVSQIPATAYCSAIGG
jgi:hypothetical protein